MSKKVILSSLLASAAILGAASSADAATSAIKAESKQITITKDNAKLYKDSTMKESTTARKGNVYIVDGYRDINGKHVYRLYQKDQYNEMKYKGYLVNTDARDLKSEDAKGQFVAKKEATMWNNFFWNNKREVTNQEKVFFAKYTYTLGNGDKYYSMYYKNADGKDTWAGYTNQVNVKPLQATQESKKFTLTRDYKTWNNLYFKQNKNSYDYTKGVNFQAKRYYTLNGNKFYSVYRTDAQGKEQWCGYANGYVLKELTATKVTTDKQQVIVQKPTWNTYKDHYFNKKGTLQAVENKVITMKYVYTYGNGKQYASLYDGETWLGYANVDAVTSAQPLFEAQKAANEAIEKAEEILKTAQASAESKEAAQKVIAAAKETVKGTDVSAIQNIPSQIEAAMKALEEGPTSVEKDAAMKLQAAIDLMKDVNKIGAANLDNDEDYDSTLQMAEDTLKAAKEDKATTEQIEKAITLVENFLNKLTLNTDALTKHINDIKDAASKVYMTKAQEDQINAYIKAAEEAAKDTKLSNVEKLNTINNNLKQVDEFIAAQPNQDDADKLIAKLKAVAAIEKLPNKGQDLGKKEELNQPLEQAIKDFKALETDAPGKNAATVNLSKDDIQKDAAALEAAISSLTVDEDALKDVITEAEKYAGSNKEEITEPLNTLKEESNDSNLGNYQDIVDAAKAVYGPMLDGLQKVVDEVKPWNNNQVTDDPEVQPEEIKQEATKAIKEVKEEDTVAVPGEVLKVTDFATYVEDKADTVADYYKEDTYAPFGDDLAAADALLKDKAAKTTVSADDLAKRVAELNSLISELPTERDALRFDKEKLIKLYKDSDTAKNAWIYSQQQVGKEAATVGTKEDVQKTIPQNKITAQAQAANNGRWHLGNVYMTGGDSNNCQISDDKLKATDENAKEMWKYIYATMETYYQYISTVKWDVQSQAYVKGEYTPESTTDSTDSSTSGSTSTDTSSQESASTSDSSAAQTATTTTQSTK